MKRLNQVGTALAVVFFICNAALARNIRQIEENERNIDSEAEAFAGDLVGSSSRHQSEWKKGGGGVYHSDHHGSHGERGNNGYKGYHQFQNDKQGHHNKEEHSGHYGENGGHNHHYHDAGGHHHRDHYATKGEKGHNYGEKGGYKKGHSIKGQHDIHKINEYKKNKEFYDEDHESDQYEKHGGHHHLHGAKAEKFHKSGHESGGFEDQQRGNFGHHNLGSHFFLVKGLGNSAGFREHFDRGEQFDKSGALQGYKKWLASFGKY